MSSPSQNALSEAILFLFKLAWHASTRVPLTIAFVLFFLDVNLRVDVDINVDDHDVDGAAD